MKKTILIFLLAFGVLSGCRVIAPTPKTNPTEKYAQGINTWLGGSEKNLVAQNGIPDSTYYVDDAKILEYRRGNSYSYCITTFTIENGTIVNINFRGDYCKKGTN